MVMSAGYLADLNAVKFNEGTNETWIQAMTLGEYDHPIHGTIAITPERIKTFADNVNNKVRSQDLDIDYEHKVNGGEAAGWVKAAEARNNGLYLLVEWTTKAATAIREKAYKYFSPEFVDQWTHPKSGVTFKDVLFGGGITNRPFLKDILPINMSEFFANAGIQQPNNQEGIIMSPEQIKSLAEKLGIDPASTADDVHKKLMEHFTADAQEEQNESKAGKGKGGVAVITPEATALSEELKKLTESNPIVATLAETVNAQARQLAEVTKRLRDQDIAVTVKELQDSYTKKNVAIAPSVLGDLTKALTESTSVLLSELIVKAFKGVAEANIVALGEKGSLRNSSKDETSPIAKFQVAIKKFQADDKGLTFADAAIRVAAEDPELFADYQAASYAGKE